jgi:hypothetical protein
MKLLLMVHCHKDVVNDCTDDTADVWKNPWNPEERIGCTSERDVRIPSGNQ